MEGIRRIESFLMRIRDEEGTSQKNKKEAEVLLKKISEETRRFLSYRKRLSKYKKVVELLKEGRTIREISQTEALSPQTVQTVKNTYYRSISERT